METKELLSLIGYEGDADLEKVKSHIQTNFVHTNLLTEHEAVKKLIDNEAGRVYGTLETKLKKAVKDLDFDLEEVKDKPTLEKLDYILNDKVKGKINALKEETTKSLDEKTKTLSEELTKAQKQAKEYAELTQSLQGKLSETEETYKGQLKNYKLNTKLTEIKSSIPFSKDVDEFRLIGFNTKLSENYKFDLDENENIIALDKDGNRVTNSNKTGFLEAKDVILSYAEQAKLLAKNDANPTKTTITQGSGKDDNEGGMFIHPSLR
jgi:hypothetical protein